MTSITYDDVRDVLGKTSSQVSDSDLTPEKGVAERLVTRELDPYSTDTDALQDTAAYVAAAFYTQEGTVGQMSQGSQQVSFVDGSMSYWRIAKQIDPTGRIGQLEKPNATMSVVDTKGIDD